MVEARDYEAIALEYARATVEGRIPAAKWQVAACARQLHDLARAETVAFQYRYDARLGARVCLMLELLPHVKGRWKTRTLRLEAWQVFIVMTVFSWVCATAAHADEAMRERDGLRRFRTAYVEVPRKNAKSTIAAGVGLYLLGPDDEPGAEVYSAATTREQAKIVFNVARQMALRTPEYCARFGVEPGIHALVALSTESTFKALSSDDQTLDGLNPHGAIVDELHAHRTRGVWDVLETATGARAQSLLLAITTAGSDRAGICFEVRSYVLQILGGALAAHPEIAEARGYELKGATADDESFFGIIYTIDDARRVSLQVAPALAYIEKECNCGTAQDTLIEKLSRAAFARRATTGSDEQQKCESAANTLTGPSDVADSAEAATKSFSSSRARSDGLERARLSNDGLARIPTGREQRVNDGSIAAANPTYSPADGSETTESARPSMTSSTRSKTAAAESVDEAHGSFALITAIAQELCGDFFASAAIAELASSEILPKVYEAHSSTCRARKAKLRGNSLHVLIADDWTDPLSWAKANPNLGVSVKEDDIARACLKAQRLPSAQPNFLTKRLNVWVNADSAWMDMRAWSRCGNPELRIEQFSGVPAIVALDLSSKTDIAATAILFRRVEMDTTKAGEPVERIHYYAFGRYYLPEDTIEESDNSQYRGWATSQYLIETDGNTTDFARIREDLTELRESAVVAEVGIDVYQARQLGNELQEDGLTVVEIPMTVKQLSEPMKELEAAVLGGRFHHDGNPALAWMMSNVVAHRDRKDNIFPNKPTANAKIDGAVALIMAVSRALVAPAPPARSVYETRGPVFG